MGKIRKESKQAKHRKLKKLFDAQIATLKDREVPNKIVEILQDQKDLVVERAIYMTIGNGNIPFLPVISHSHLIPYNLIAIEWNFSNVDIDYVYLNTIAIFNMVDIPEEPHYIYDVEDGNATRGKNPEAAEKIFKRQKRSPLTVAEVIALAVHANVYPRYGVWATGSRYKSARKVPFIYLDSGGQLRFIWGVVDDLYDDRWGSASCLSR